MASVTSSRYVAYESPYESDEYDDDNDDDSSGDLYPLVLAYMSWQAKT